jgi:acyl-coenzyme A synthetase/AMP-(fatty) acid ligase
MTAPCREQANSSSRNDVRALRTLAPDTRLTAALQSFVKKRIAPYKYPRAVEYVS